MTITPTMPEPAPYNPFNIVDIEENPLFIDDDIDEGMFDGEYYDDDFDPDDEENKQQWI